jgi:hypothetical protein
MANDASPELFHDANQTIPEATPSTATNDTTSITNESSSTLSPLQAARQLFPATDQLEDLTCIARTSDWGGRDFLTTCPSTNYVWLEAQARKFGVPPSDQNFQRGK